MTAVSQNPETATAAGAGHDRQRLVPPAIVNQLVKGTFTDVFSLLGMHSDASGNRQITVFLPGALAVEAISPTGRRSLGAL